MTISTQRQSAGMLRVLGLALLLGGLLLVVGYTLVTLREIAAIEAVFGELSSGVGRGVLLRQMLVVDALGVGAAVLGAVLLLQARRRRLGTSGPIVREIRPDEHAAAAEVVLAGYRELLGDVDDGYEQVLADVPDRAEHATVLVAAEGPRLVGCVTYVDGLGKYAEFPDDDAAGIRMLAVLPEARSRGVGESLVRACVERARSSGRARVVLHSTGAMAAAQRLYGRLGFRRAPERDWEVEPGFILLGYELELGA
jgi:ribosomal protein S18 acetylase RimI-like enzyme